MFRFLTVISFVMLISISVSSQELYRPRDVQKAFHENTRSVDGKPGKNYWQNHGRYDITVTASPPNRTIYGTEKISYINNSPDTLRSLAFKLFMNVHKAGAPRLFGFGTDYLTDGVKIDSFSVNGQQSKWGLRPFAFTNDHSLLPKPLAGHDSVQLYIEWHYDMSLRSFREGMIDSTTFYLAYFYPRVAVYDDYQGWDNADFNDALEFYSDFNDYTVNVQVPKNYIVWGTGTLLNPTEVLQPAYAQKFQQSLTSDDIIHVVKQQDLSQKNITAQHELNTWQFKADNIPDMAFGLSDHFVWDASSLIIDDLTKRRVSVQAAYNDTAADFHHMVHFGKESLSFLSNVWPGIPYPYEKSTLFQGYADMEYPMMVNDETDQDTTISRFVALHEIAHTYMPFYMGINETRYGFMDEGWATTFELLFNRDLMGSKADTFYKSYRVEYWINDPSPDEDLPIITPGTSLNGINGYGLGSNEYGKPSLGYLAMKELLGDSMFRKCLHEYMDRWHGKHPLPWDFFNTFSNTSGTNLNWFWNNWFFSNYYIDLAINNVAIKGNRCSVSINNIGGMASPFNIVLTYTDSTTETFHQKPSVWRANQKQITVNVGAKKAVLSVKLDGGIYMDANGNDNVWVKH